MCNHSYHQRYVSLVFVFPTMCSSDRSPNVDVSSRMILLARSVPANTVLSKRSGGITNGWRTSTICSLPRSRRLVSRLLRVDLGGDGWALVGTWQFLGESVPQEIREHPSTAVVHLRLLYHSPHSQQYLAMVRTEASCMHSKKVHEEQVHRKYKPIHACASESASSSVLVQRTKAHVRATCVLVYRIRSRGLLQEQWHPEAAESPSRAAKN